MTNLQILTLDSLIPENLPNLSPLTLEQETDLKLAIYYLHGYQALAEGSSLEQVQGYLEAFHHLGNLSAWQAAAQLIQLPLSPTDDAFASLPIAAQSDSDVQPSSNTAIAEGDDHSPNPETSDLPPATCHRIAKPLHEQLGLWGYYHQQHHLCQQLLGKVDPTIDCLCLEGLGYACRQLGRFNTAQAYSQQQLSLASRLGNRRAELDALSGLGMVCAKTGSPKLAIKHHQQQLALARSLSDQWQESLALHDLGDAYVSLAHYGQAIRYLEQAATLAADLDDPDLHAKILPSLGSICMYGGQYQKAIHYLECCLAMGNGLTLIRRIGVLENLGIVYGMGLQQHTAAEGYLHQALALYQETDDRLGEATALNNLGVIYTHFFKQPDRALPLLQKALRCGQQAQYVPMEAVALANLCNCQIYLGDHAQANDYATAALAKLKEGDYPESHAVVLATLANAHWYQGKRVHAIWLVIRSLWVLPPWRSANGNLIFRRFLQEISTLWQRWWPWQRVKGEG